MALTFEITSAAGLWIDLADESTYGIGSGSGVGAPTIERLWRQATTYQSPRLVGTRVDVRNTEIPVHVRGTGVDTWAARYKLMARLIRDAEAGVKTWLRVQFTGETNPTDYDVLGGDVPDARYLSHDFVIKYITTYRPFKLTLSPWGRRSQLTRNTATLVNGGGTANSGATISVTPDSERPTPLRIHMDGVAGVRTILMSTRTKGTPANIPFPLHCETGTYTGYATTDIEASVHISGANTVVAGAQNGNVWRLTTNTTGVSNEGILQWALNSPSEWYGRWRAFLRVDSLQSMANLDIHITYVGTDGVLVENTHVDDLHLTLGSDDLVDLGYVNFIKPPEGAASASLNIKLRMAIAASSTTKTIDLDCLYLIPWDEWSFEGQLNVAVGSSSSGATAILLDNLSDPSGFVVMTTTGIFTAEYISAPRQVPLPRLLWVPKTPNRLFILLFDGDSTPGGIYNDHDLTLTTISTTIDHYDLYDLIRGA